MLAGVAEDPSPIWPVACPCFESLLPLVFAFHWYLLFPFGVGRSALSVCLEYCVALVYLYMYYIHIETIYIELIGIHPSHNSLKPREDGGDRESGMGHERTLECLAAQRL